MVVNQKMNFNLKGFGEKVGTMKIAANQAAARLINNSDKIPAKIGFIGTHLTPSSVQVMNSPEVSHPV